MATEHVGPDSQMHILRKSVLVRTVNTVAHDAKWRGASEASVSPMPGMRICVVAAGHLATCPRMLKAADALHDAGYQVRMVSTSSTKWAEKADRDAKRTRQWKWTTVDVSRSNARLVWLIGGLRYHAASRLVGWAGTSRCPLALCARAYARAHTELVRSIISEPADMIYGGQSGALAAVGEAGVKMGIPFALDLEDFHTGELLESPVAERIHSLAERVERQYLPKAAFLSAGSVAIAEAYLKKYGVRAIPINNTFPLPDRAPVLSPFGNRPLRLYWFSQTVGPCRGLEDVVRAIGIADLVGELHLRGRSAEGYIELLKKSAEKVAPRLQIYHHEPASPDLMVELCRDYDCGLAPEPGFSPNNLLALSNKIHTYMLAGLAVVLSDTPGQRVVGRDLQPNAVIYPPGNVDALASGLKRWADDRSLLAAAKAAAWEAAKRRWHWEHPQERGALLDAVSRVLGPNT